MGATSKSILITSTFVIFIFTAYFATYLALVDRAPVYYGSNLRKLLAPGYMLLNREGDSQIVVPPEPPDAYSAVYTSDARFVYEFFKPAHLLDRQLRPEYWPRPRRRAGC